MSRYDEKCRYDAIQDMIAEDAMERRWLRRDYCEHCEEHNESCPYYDENEETWDYDECFRDRGEF